MSEMNRRSFLRAGSLCGIAGNWVGSEELGTYDYFFVRTRFDKNLPETVQPIENPIAVCTGNTVVQVWLLHPAESRAFFCKWASN